jgi:Serine hydrolase (FSH1)
MARLPRIACFHGGGSNSDIFTVQCKRLQKVLENDFEFVYFDAPFERSAGPGVLPAFKDYAPFKTWFKIDENGRELSDGSGYDQLGTDGVERVLKLMEAEGPAEDWVGAMGFSQGTRVVGGLLFHQQRRAATGRPRDIDLKFGILCMGGRAPMESEISHGTLKIVWIISPSFESIIDFDTAMNNDRSTSGLESAAKSKIELISIPTLHLHGLKDENLSNGRQQMASYYDPRTTTLYEIDYHHAMPWVTLEILQLAALIKRIYKNV